MLSGAAIPSGVYVLLELLTLPMSKCSMTGHDAARMLWFILFVGAVGVACSVAFWSIAGGGLRSERHV
jgi:hypothetical protein